jgi:hypothetical protein
MEDRALALGDQHHAGELVSPGGRPQPPADLARHLRFGHAAPGPLVRPLDGRVADRDDAVIAEPVVLPGVGECVHPGPVVAPAGLYQDLERLAAGRPEHLQPAALPGHPSQPRGALGHRGLLQRRR